MKNDRRGLAAPLALMAVLSVSTLIAVGMQNRSRELSFEHRARGRVCARWAAEAGLNRLRASIAKRGWAAARLKGELGAQGRYDVQVQKDGRVLSVVSRGRCADRESTEMTLELRATLRGKRLRTEVRTESFARR